MTTITSPSAVICSCGNSHVVILGPVATNPSDQGVQVAFECHECLLIGVVAAGAKYPKEAQNARIVL